MLIDPNMRILTIFRVTLRHELLLAVRSFSELLNPLWFFGMASCLFPLAIGPDPAQLRLLAPGIIWIAALLAALLTLERLFRCDITEGVLEQRLLDTHPLSFWVFAKVLAHWIVTGIPLLGLATLLGLALHLSAFAVMILIATLALGTPILYLVGSIAAALTVRLQNSGMLLLLLILPLYVPVLIFATHAVSLADAGLDVRGQLAFLGSFLLVAICLAPLATAAALRISSE